MIFCGSASGSLTAMGPGSGAAATGAAGSGVGAATGLGGGGGACGSEVARIREMGGRNDERVGAASPSGRLARGFFSSISETVSITGFGGAGGAAGAGAGDFVAVVVEWTRGLVVGAATAGVRACFTAAGSGLLWAVSFRFGSTVFSFALETTGLSDLRAGVVLRAAVLVVVRVGIVVPGKNRKSSHPTTRRSLGERPRGSPSPSLRPR